MFESWYIFVLISIVAIAFGEIGQKLSITSKLNISAKTINFCIGSLQLLLSLIYLILFTPNLEISLNFIQLIGLGLTGILSYFFFDALYSSYKGNSASISQVIFSFSAVVSTLLGILLFSESVSTIKFLGIALILIGVLIVTINKGEKLSKYNLLAILAAVIYAFLTNTDKYFSTSINPDLYQVLSVASFLFSSLMFSGKKIIREIKIIDKPLFKTILISTLAYTISNKLTYFSYASGGEVGKVDAINNSSVLLIILLEILILRDKSSLRKKVIASSFTVLGVLILGLIE